MDELSLITLAAAKSYTDEHGGGGGGTTNYNLLSNKPQINSVELSGNKSLSDLGIASASALADKVDKVEGKGLSTNDFTDAYKTAIGSNTTAINGIKNGEEINSFGGVESALAGKQNATDNNLDTDAKTIVGAINEHEGDISSLKSGLTNVDVALSVPEGTGRNVLPLTLTNLKTNNTDGVWSGNTYNRDNVAFTVQTDVDDNVISINVSGTASANTFIILDKGNLQKYKRMILNGCPVGGSENTYNIKLQKALGDYAVYATDIGNGYTLPDSITSDNTILFIRIVSGYNAENLTFAPMIRPATITDSTFAPYIPSVESRIEAVESGLESVESDLTGVFTADLLYEGAPTQADTYEEKNLISGKSITDYLLILFVCRQYNNTVAFAIEPKHVFIQQTGDSSRVIFKYGDGTLQTVMVYYVSPTKIAVNQKTVDGTIWKTALYGIIKQP